MAGHVGPDGKLPVGIGVFYRTPSENSDGDFSCLHSNVDLGAAYELDKMAVNVACSWMYYQVGDNALRLHVQAFRKD